MLTPLGLAKTSDNGAPLQERLCPRQAGTGGTQDMELFNKREGVRNGAEMAALFLRLRTLAESIELTPKCTQRESVSCHIYKSVR